MTATRRTVQAWRDNEGPGRQAGRTGRDREQEGRRKLNGVKNQEGTINNVGNKEKSQNGGFGSSD